MSRTKRAVKRTVKRRARRRNSSELLAAARMSEQFHGRPAKHIRAVEETERYRRDLAWLGKAVDLQIDVEMADGHVRPFTFPSGVSLACNPKGTQLYFVGGDQSLNEKKLGLGEKDLYLIGPVHFIAYQARKGLDNFELATYEHEFGEEGGELPFLLYDAVAKKVRLAGGSYKIRWPGILN